MEKTKVNYEETRAVGKKIMQYADGYGQIYSQQLYTTFKNSLENCFQGDDAKAAMAQLDALRDDFEAMKEVVWRYGKQLENAANGYEEDMGVSALKAGKLTGNRK